MSVDSQHPEYAKHVKEWVKVFDCCEGQRAIKEKENVYLPIMEGVSRRDARYRNYLERAVFVNYTGRTKDGLLGALFRKDAQIEIPEQLDYLLTNADGSGESLESLSKDVSSEVISKGRHLLLVDFPNIQSELTLEEQVMINPQAAINRYVCENVINWRVDVIGGKKIVDLLVLREEYDSNSDEFERNVEYQYRVLRIREGVYTQQVYRDGKPATEEIAPKKADGSYFDMIPAVFIGSENNDASVDISPLADIANVNLAHYRNSADLEENCFVHGQLTLGISSQMSPTQFAEANPNGITVGAMSGHFLGEGGSFTSVQASSNQLADTLMQRKEEQMRKLGARMIVIGSMEGTKQTATQSKIDATGESSMLSTIADNVSEGISKAIEWCGEFMGVDASESVYQVNKKFFDDEANPQMLIAAMQLNDRGIVAKSDLQDLARLQGIVDPSRTNEDIDGEIEIAQPLPTIEPLQPFSE